MKLDKIIIEGRFRKDIGDLETLKKSIQEIGLLHPIVINENNKLIAGLRRLEACKALGWEDIPVTVVNLENIVRGECDENVIRKSFLPTEIAAISKALRPIEEEKARERKVKGGRKYGEKHPQEVGAICPNLLDQKKKRKPRARDNVASFVGVGGRTLEKIEEIIEMAEVEPEKYGSLVKEMDVKGKVDGVYKKLNIKKKEEEKIKQYTEKEHLRSHIIHGDSIELLDKIEDESFDLLLTDPPYSTEEKDFEEFLKQWLPKAVNKIKDTGRIYIFSGSYISEIEAYINVLNTLNNRFELSNFLIWHYQNNIGPKPKLAFKRGWQGIFYLYGKNASALNSPLTKDLFDHFNYSMPDGRQEKKYHSHQKPEELIKHLIALSSKEGDKLLDLFAGSGTIGLVASKLGRYCLSIEKNKKFFEICIKRGLVGDVI